MIKPTSHTVSVKNERGGCVSTKDALGWTRCYFEIEARKIRELFFFCIVAKKMLKLKGRGSVVEAIIIIMITDVIIIVVSEWMLP